MSYAVLEPPLQMERDEKKLPEREKSSAPPPVAQPTKKTLVFPASEIRRSSSSPSKIPTSKPPAVLPIAGAMRSDSPRAPLILSTDDSDESLVPNVTIPKSALVPKDVEPVATLLAIDRLEQLDEQYLEEEADDNRPSERSTVPTLSSKGVAAPSSDQVALQLSGSELKTDLELPKPDTLPAGPVPAYPLRKRGDRLASTIPPPLPAQWKWRREVSLHSLLRGRSSNSASDSKMRMLELELGEEVESDPIELSRVSRPAQHERDDRDHDHDRDHDRDHDANDGQHSSERAHAEVRTDPPPNHASTPPTSLLGRIKSVATSRRVALPVIATHVAVAAVVALIVGSGRAPAAHTQSAVQDPSTMMREPRAATSERKHLVSAPGVTTPSPPSGGCAATGAARALASKAQIGPGLEVSVLDTGFGLALASGNTEAVGLRIEGSWLRVAETVRVKSSTLVSHVAIDGHEEEGGEGFDVRIDSDDARTVTGAADAPSFRVVARGGYILALLDDPNRMMAVRNIWPVPGILAPPPRTAALAPAASPYRPPGFLGKTAAAPVANVPRSTAPQPIHPYIYANETVRAVGRDDGGLIVALRRPSSIWLGVADSAFVSAGAMVNIQRKGANVGTPALAQWGGGGAVAWAERVQGEREWSIVVAGFTPDGEGATTVNATKIIAKGMSPSIAALPDGDLLLAIADGTAGAHRVVTYRLGRDLEVKGEPLVVSPDTINAGQPAITVRPDGRSLVAFFAAERGRPTSVYATPLMCDPGL